MFVSWTENLHKKCSFHRNPFIFPTVLLVSTCILCILKIKRLTNVNICLKSYYNGSWCDTVSELRYWKIKRTIQTFTDLLWSRAWMKYPWSDYPKAMLNVSVSWEPLESMLQEKSECVQKALSVSEMHIVFSRSMEYVFLLRKQHSRFASCGLMNFCLSD